MQLKRTPSGATPQKYQRAPASTQKNRASYIHQLFHQTITVVAFRFPREREDLTGSVLFKPSHCQ